tara:strand:- start:99 stop:629 length:531 start_codon:yes stop_codon:yes gene_type:complete
MTDHQQDFVPLEDYFNTDFDFGITPMDNEELDVVETSDGVADVNENYIESIENINSRINSIFMLLESDDDTITNDVVFSRIEEKVDKILDMETNEFSRALQDNSDNIKVIIDEIEERKKELESKSKEKMIEIEGLILPLLYNLIKSPDKNYIYWPDRKDKIETQIRKIISVTRKDS